MRKMHLNKGGSGWASQTACGRSMLRTPMSANWADFKKEETQHQCDKCLASKQFALNTKMDSRKVA